MEVVYKDFNILSENQVKYLYEKAGWTTYTKNIKKLLSGIQNSSFVCSAWVNNQMVGLIRVLSDDYTICYIQDLLVMDTHQKQGIGKTLVEIAIKKYANVRQIILTTDETGPCEFYEKIGFKPVKNYGCNTYMIIQNDQ
ncbi:MAG TPA: GNAT family N-acetyltransferase [Candidatus Izemoplasmatales bacterium]|nr:GNAT family N-acetyltransferase [Candidatus Izemoplasmatales bacterium]